MAEHIHFLNSWPDNRMNHLVITLEVAEKEAVEHINSERWQIIAAARHELRLTERLVVPLVELTNAACVHSPQPPVRMAAALA